MKRKSRKLHAKKSNAIATVFSSMMKICASTLLRAKLLSLFLFIGIAIGGTQAKGSIGMEHSQFGKEGKALYKEIRTKYVILQKSLGRKTDISDIFLKHIPIGTERTSAEEILRNAGFTLTQGPIKKFEGSLVNDRLVGKIPKFDQRTLSTVDVIVTIDFESSKVSAIRGFIYVSTL